jgi:hypothetical protein
MLGTGRATKCIDWKVFGKNQHILDPIRSPGLMKLKLNVMGLLIGGYSQIKQSSVQRHCYPCAIC